MYKTAVRGIVLVAIIISSWGPAFGAEDTMSVNYMLPGCRQFVSSPPVYNYNIRLELRGMKCAGIVEGVGFAGSGICGPATVTTAQAVRVVVKFIEHHPEMQHKRFPPLALEALRAAWPCKAH